MNPADIWKYDLIKGSADDPSGGACVMQAVSWFAGEAFTDKPKCASPVLTAFCIGANDQLADDDRQGLKQFIFRLMGSKDPAAEQARLHYIVLNVTRRIVSKAADLPEFRMLANLPNTATLEEIKAAAYAAANAANAAANAYAAAYAAADAANAAADIFTIIDGALNLGKQGDMDPAEAIAAVERFELAREAV